jgi:hypothetical protein
MHSEALMIAARATLSGVRHCEPSTGLVGLVTLANEVRWARERKATGERSCQCLIAPTSHHDSPTVVLVLRRLVAARLLSTAASLILETTI